MRRAWPGWDGWLLLALLAAVLAVWLVRGRPAGEASLVACAALDAIYLGVTWGQRRRGPPVPEGLRVAVVIPSKDNAGSVADVVRGALAHLPDVVVVDDGSTDGTGDRARATGATVLSHGTNLGKGVALTTAFDWLRERGFTHAVTLDADGQHLPDDLPAFLAAIAAEPAALHLGARDMSTPHVPESSRFGRRFSNLWVRLETGVWLADTQCGYRAYPLWPIATLPLRHTRYDWEVEVVTRALWAGVPCRDLPCRVRYPPAEARVTSFRPVLDNLRMAVTHAELCMGRLLWPPRWLPARVWAPSGVLRGRAVALRAAARHPAAPALRPPGRGVPGDGS